MSPEVWVEVRDGDVGAQLLFNRHYSKYHYRDGRKVNPFVGPGQRIVLVNWERTAMLVWRKFIDKSGQKGVNCSVFRNENHNLKSSELILAAEEIAWRRWPDERLYTYVNPRAVKSANPGYCFKMAGWSLCGVTKTRKLLILEKLPTKKTTT